MTLCEQEQTSLEASIHGGNTEQAKAKAANSPMKVRVEVLTRVLNALTPLCPKSVLTFFRVPIRGTGIFGKKKSHFFVRKLSFFQFMDKCMTNSGPPLIGALKLNRRDKFWPNLVLDRF